LERTETNTTSPFGPFRERSAQRFTYTREKTFLVTEIDFKHVQYKDLYGLAPEKNYLFQASFNGQNLSAGQDIRGGRIWTGNDLLQAVDGLSWFYPWGESLSSTFQFGQIAKIDTADKTSRPSFAEGRLNYKFNQNAWMAVQACKNYDEDFGSTMLGYTAENVKLIGEYRAGAATDSMHLGLQAFDGKRWDLTSDYYLNQNDSSNSGVMRHYLGLELGALYFEAGYGNVHWFNGPELPETSFYEGSVCWGASDKDKLSLGYSLEDTVASASRTLSVKADRRVSAKTTLSLGLQDTRFEQSGGSIQNMEAGIRRRVDWGYFELRGAVISGGQDSDLQKDVSLRAGYEF
jgi:hypothetical protein